MTVSIEQKIKEAYNLIKKNFKDSGIKSFKRVNIAGKVFIYGLDNHDHIKVFTCIDKSQYLSKQ